MVTTIPAAVLIAVAGRRAVGQRWVMLRAAAEAIKAEIYRYRALAAVDASRLAGGEHASRQQELAAHLDAIDTRLMQTQASSGPLTPYNGPLPPEMYGAGRDDDGLSPLDAERYLQIRVADQLAYYHGRVRSLDRGRNALQLLAIAAGVVFFGLLAVFPAVTALVSCYGLFANPSTISANLQTLALMLPEGSFQIVQDQIARVLAKGNTELGATFLFGLALAIWSANAGVKAIIDALNVVYDEREKRSFLRLNLLSLAFTTGGIAALLLMVGAVVAFPLALDYLGLAPKSQFIVSLARWPLLFLVLVTALAILYRFGPSRWAARWEWLSVGTLTAALLWIVGSSLFSWYLSNFGNYSATYGSLGAAIGLMMWMWMSAIIVLCGAELNSEIEHQLVPDTTVGPPKPLGARGAAMADTLGPAVPQQEKEH